MRKLLGVVLCGVVCLWVPSLHAKGKGDGVTQTVGHGKINWTEKTITVTGSGAPSLKAANAAVARLGAERAAKMDAFRNILEAVKGIRVNEGESAGAMMAATPQLKSEIEGVVRNFKVLDTKYYSDGGVDLIVQVPLDGVLVGTLIPKAGTKAVAAGDSGGVTGVIINAKGLGVTPALSPRLLDDKGAAVYAADLVKKEKVRSHGVAGYSKSLDAAMKNARVADKPLILKGIKLNSASGSDIFLASDDAAKLASLGSVLSDGKVIIVID